MNRDDTLEKFRLAVLDALDEAARDTFGEYVTNNTPGATDADLPELFKVIDRQTDKIAGRLCIELTDD